MKVSPEAAVRAELFAIFATADVVFDDEKFVKDDKRLHKRVMRSDRDILLPREFWTVDFY